MKSYKNISKRHFIMLIWIPLNTFGKNYKILRLGNLTFELTGNYIETPDSFTSKETGEPTRHQAPVNDYLQKDNSIALFSYKLSIWKAGFNYGVSPRANC